MNNAEIASLNFCRVAIVAMALMILSATAGDKLAWVRLDAAEILVALDEKTLIYTGANQVFYTSGKTRYNQGGRASWGFWRVQNDQYCSQWPPGNSWACYDLEQNGEQVRFVGKEGDFTIGDYAKLNDAE